MSADSCNDSPTRAIVASTAAALSAGGAGRVGSSNFVIRATAAAAQPMSSAPARVSVPK